MKKRKLTPIILMLVACAMAVSAKVEISEIMYAPNQTASETDSEWIELYNTAPTEVNMTGWTLNGNEFYPATIGGMSYLVVARELEDGSDEDTDSFQSVWGTDIPAADGSFILSNTGGTITLNDDTGSTVDEATYTSDIGGLKNGNTIEKVSGAWQEGEYGGTPGYGSAPNLSAGDEATVTLTLENSAPEIRSASYDATNIYASVYDANGLDDVAEVYADISGQVVNMFLEAAIFKAQLPELTAGTHNATIYASDSNTTVSESILIVIDSIASLNLVQDSIDFTDMKAGETKNTTIELQNNGNVDLSIDFAIAGEEVLQDNLKCYDTDWQDIATCSVTIPSGETRSLQLQLSVPEGTKAGEYSAKLQTTATVL